METEVARSEWAAVSAAVGTASEKSASGRDVFVALAQCNAALGAT